MNRIIITKERRSPHCCTATEPLPLDAWKLYIMALLIFGVASVTANARTYSHKAARPAASDHRWFGYDYTFNIDDESGMLTGLNTFSLVYNTAPPRWKNSGYYGEGIRMLTGRETLAIKVLPGDFNYIYTLTSNVVEWQWDTHTGKWVKRRAMPYNGTRSFAIKDGVLEGSFDIPVSANLFAVRYLCGVSKNGIVPQGSRIEWEYLDLDINNNRRTKSNWAVVPDGDSIRLNIENYITDVLKNSDMNSLYLDGASDENGTFVKMKFPISQSWNDYPTQYHDILSHCASLAGIGSSALDMYSQITLPDVYYDKYVSKYAPVTTILDNGHKKVSTLQADGSTDYVESWEENGYLYEKTKKSGKEYPVIGKKETDGKMFIHVINDNPYDKYEEKGFIDDGEYFMTYLKTKEFHSPIEYRIDWTPYKSEGYYTITDSDGKKYATVQEDAARHTYTAISISSSYFNKNYENYIFKEESKDGIVTVSASNTMALSPQANDFVRFVRHPYVRDKYKTKYHISTVSMNEDGNVVIISPKEYERREPDKYGDRIGYYNWEKDMLNKSRSINNPLNKLAALIDMELDIPDYDTSKPEAKVVGKRTAKLLKKLCSMLKEKNHKGDGVTKLDSNGIQYQDYENIWPNKAKKIVTEENRWTEYKKVSVERISKKGNKVTVVINLLTEDDNTDTVTMQLENNIPVDKYVWVWESVALSVK